MLKDWPFMLAGLIVGLLIGRLFIAFWWGA